MNSFRTFIEKLQSEKKLMECRTPVSVDLEASSILKTSEPCPVLFPKIKESEFRIAGNIFSTKEMVAKYLGCKKEELTLKLINAIENPKKPELVKTGPVFENTLSNPDLSKIPVPVYLEKDGGPYFTSAIVIANDPEYGRNLSFHRMMVIEKNKVVARILNRHLNSFIERADKRGEELDIAVIIGSPINVLLSGAISLDLGFDELAIANSLMPLKTVKLSNGIEVSNDVEFALQGKVKKEITDEGPFLDLTETYDIVRKQRVFEITKIHYRNNPIFHALLPGGLEHKILMGMPKEPTIFKEVNKICECTGVNITPGGCSWLHAAVSIKKEKDSDARDAIEASFKGHKSLKHVVIVDSDIDITNPAEVEWAIATRFQASKNIVIKENEKGSSLDPSADPNTYITSKMGLDCTVPFDRKQEFAKTFYPKADLKKYF
ncbi:MAG: UbiD family decarboxylase [Candidatus Micrarchaeia archaeon]